MSSVTHPLVQVVVGNELCQHGGRRHVVRRDGTLDAGERVAVRLDLTADDGSQAEQLERLDRIRPALTEDGRTLAQAALGWVWARSGRAVPIPGFKTAQQVEEIAAAAERGPLRDEQVAEIRRLLRR
jgi:aryl-alcohol dehydrogenase-like predicted oxidoreductase